MGEDSLIRPSIGSWVSYGLRTENSNLPAFVSMNHGASGLDTPAGYSQGETDDYGYPAAVDKVHMHDTILHLLGFDPEKLTYRYAGRDFRLTDV